MNKDILNDWLGRRKISDAVTMEFGVTVGFHPSFGDCIAIPIFNEDGSFSFNKYRRSPLSEEKPKYLYDKGSKATLYGYYAAKKFQTILITEGEIDCLVAWSANIPAVSSTGGALSFQKEWAEFLKNKDVIVCFDNDGAGGEGMVKVLEILPKARVLFLPDRPGVKDISDYAANGGDLNVLLKTAIHFPNIESVIENRAERMSLWKSTHFHDAYIARYSKPVNVHTERSPFLGSKVENAKLHPITELMPFIHNKASCIFHNERTASLHYYPDTNRCYCFGGCGKSFDSIDIYRRLNNCGFKEAVDKLQV